VGVLKGVRWYSRHSKRRGDREEEVEKVSSQAWLRELVAEIKDGLRALYGVRLRGVFLFGSQARRDAGPESDVDLLIVLDEVPHYVGEVKRTRDLTSSVALRHDVSISCVFVSAAEWEQGEGPFLDNVREDAVAA
jgi:predicted nucleotidyltransferase